MYGRKGYFLFITRAENQLWLPGADGLHGGGHVVKRVQDYRWVTVDLKKVLVKPSDEQELSAAAAFMTSFIVDDLHFFCETYDVTRPFPSLHDPILE